MAIEAVGASLLNVMPKQTCHVDLCNASIANQSCCGRQTASGSVKYIILPLLAEGAAEALLETDTGKRGTKMPCASSAFTTSVRPFQCFLLVAQSRPRLKMFCIFWSLFATSCAGREVRNTVLQAR